MMMQLEKDLIGALTGAMLGRIITRCYEWGHNRQKNTLGLLIFKRTQQLCHYLLFPFY